MLGAVVDGYRPVVGVHLGRDTVRDAILSIEAEASAHADAQASLARLALREVIAAIEDHTSPDGICRWNRWEHEAVRIARAALEQQMKRNAQTVVGL